MILTHFRIILVSLLIQYKFIRQFKVEMADMSKRSLRQRRAPKNFDSDNEDQDPWGYSKPSYSKETRNPTQQLNSEAKLLVKFLSAINKSHREYETEQQKRQIENIKEPLTVRQRKIKTIQPQFQPPKRYNEGLRQTKPEPPKKQKQPYSFKAQTNSNDAQIQPKTESFLNKYKELNTESANKMLNIQYTLAKNKQGIVDPSRLKQQKFQAGLQASQIGNNFKKTQNQPKGKIEIKNSSQNPLFNMSEQKRKRIQEIQSTLNIPKPTVSPEKVFKRSAYHVAIAYHIHVIQVRQRGGSSNDMDPTYPARRLREGMRQ